MKPLLVLLNVAGGLILTRFTVSKFAAWPESVAGFVDMAKPLGIDPTFFRISTGFIIGFGALALLTSAILVMRVRGGKLARLFAFNQLYVLGAMTGALLSEFFLRSNVKWMLVYIAAAVIAVALSNLAYAKESISGALRARGLTTDPNASHQ